jgi:hypothetical protein
LLALSALLLPFATARIARANGLELLPGGTQSVSRGGAVAARAENPMTLSIDPAGMALLSGNQLLLNVDVPVHDMCFDAYGYYGWGIYQSGASEFGDPLKDPYARSPLPQVCNSGPAFPLPQTAWVGKLTDDLAIGAGFVAPTVVTGMQYGGPDGTIQTPDGPRPTPTRYQIIRQQVKFAFAPTVGVAYRVLPVLSIGLTGEIGMIDAVTRAVQNGTSGTQPSTDWLADIEAHDYFIPALTASVHAKPIPQLDLMGSFRWIDSFNGTGKVTYTTNTFDQNATSGPTPFTNDPVKLAEVKVEVPWVATIGARYAGLLAPRADEASRKGLGDPLDRELWDIEVDGSYTANSLAQNSVARAGQDVTLITRNVGGGGTSASLKYDQLKDVTVNRHARDSVAVRVGGSYSVLPRQVALEAGVFYESRGVDPAYAGVDSFAFQRIGFGLGVMSRFGDWDLLAGYGHIFSETLEVAPPDHQIAQTYKANDPTTGFDQRVGVDISTNNPRAGVVLRDPAAPSPAHADAVARAQQSSAVPSNGAPERVINAGRYTAAFNIVSVGAVYHF